MAGRAKTPPKKSPAKGTKTRAPRKTKAPAKAKAPPKPVGTPYPSPLLAAPYAELTEREARFIEAYLVEPNASEAARKAGYSAKTAAQIGYENLRKPHIKKLIEDARVERATRAGINADFILQILVEDVTADAQEIFDEHGNVRPISEWPRPFRTGLVTGLDVEEMFEGSGEDRVKVGERRKPRFADRTALKKLLGNHIKVGAFKETKVLDVTDPLKALLEEMQGNAIRPRTPPAKGDKD